MLTLEKYSKQHQELWNEILESGQVKKMIFEEEGIKKDGSLFPVEISFSIRKLEDKAIIAVMRDITERKAMEGKLIQAEKLKSLGELAGGVAHDFNNVLAAILGRVQLLKMRITPPSGKQEKRKSMLDLIAGLDVIEKASLDGAETVKRIQEFSRRRSDDDSDFVQVNVNELITNALDFTRIRWKEDAESRGIKITIKKEFADLPTTSANATELREVFTNIINNAVDAISQGGTIKIKTFMENTHIVITIKDSGIGVPKALRDRIFDPFFTTKGPLSTGLGLSVSHGIINRHRGTITVESMEGKGATFTIQLPLSKETKEQKCEEESVTPIAGRHEKARILVIEDEEDVRRLLSDILTDSGHEVETAPDGNHGIKMFMKKEFDLVFTDLGLPGISGWQIAEKVKSINKRVPVALITGWKVEQKEHVLKESGVDLIVYKPFRVNQVLKLVQEGMILKEKYKAA